MSEAIAEPAAPPMPGNGLREAATGTPAELRELKVRIPVRYHAQLRALKLVGGRPVHEVLTEALEHYFRTHPETENRL
ncbi:MAG: hypothetical protein ACT4PT_13975 [Methanobacteriota archaeon]